MKQEYGIKHDLRRDLETFRSLHGKERLGFVWDYYRYKIAAALVILFILGTFANLLWQGQKPYRLRVCAVLNTEQYCDGWFYGFEKDLKADGKKGDFELNQDQPFDYDNIYYNVQELEVLTAVSAHRMDVAICGPDMYSYLLAINSCMDLRDVCDPDLISIWETNGMLMESTAGITINRDGSENREEAVSGTFALDISDTSFGKEYNTKQKLEEGQEKEPLYAVIIQNTYHLEDSLKLLKSLSQ